ncbi:2-hydroxyacid dehydrogenase [Afipia massiliensis]|uniref:2-hydroxyacid dehydrogenase n=1 Tax=Afipia massiliensis TaxID=211460 RepID=A0A4U6BQG1_9BRAD|nr:2-hydroxyacid dehydrogenase [Afipia massiliensis]TKT72682.1 2-hydroxyacid dehydrogenase [Afipia massiliensis]
MPHQVLIFSRFPKAQMVRIGERYELLDGKGRPPIETFSAEQLKPIRAMITAGGQAIPPVVLDMLPSLGAIICYGTGYDGIDFAETARRKIAVGNSPAANAASVADLAMTLMLATTRRLVAADDYVRSGGWSGAKPSPSMRPPLGMTGRKIGIYGMGEIGRKIAARCAVFETEVAYHSRSKHDVPYAYHASLAALAEWADILMVAVRAGADTQHAVDAGILKKLGPQGTIVNISRGSVIDQAALVAALESNVIAGAGLDVYAKEPHAPDTLTTLPNVVLTPHIGGHTVEAHIAMQDCVMANLDAFFSGKPLRYPVT